VVELGDARDSKSDYAGFPKLSGCKPLRRNRFYFQGITLAGN